MSKSGVLSLLLVLAAAIGAYAYVLGPVQQWRVSTRPEDWARLGEYIGGLSVPLLFIGLLANARALRHLAGAGHRQAALEELLREARALATTIEQLLAIPAGAERTLDSARKLDLLAAVLSEYVSRGGDSIFLLFYRDRFRAAAANLRQQAVPLNTSDWWLTTSEEDSSRRWRF